MVDLADDATDGGVSRWCTGVGFHGRYGVRALKLKCVMGRLTTRRMRWLRCVGCAAVLCCCASGSSRAESKTRPVPSERRRVVEMSPWETAERGRDALEAMPEGTRTKADYAKAMDGFREIYHQHPGDSHAPSAVYAVAELLVEQGRELKDPRSLKAAMGQYEFVRTQYPGSSLRMAALLAEGQIAGNDLGDDALAREKYALVVKQYPRSAQAEEAKAALAQGAVSRDQGSGQQRAGRTAARGTTNEANRLGGKTQTSDTRVAKASANGGGSLPATAVTRNVTVPDTAAAVAGTERVGTSKPVDEALDAQSAPVGAASNSGVKPPAGGAPIAGSAKNVPKPSGKLAQVSGVRHWSTPTYTRVAIDLGDDVTYEAARVPNPDRIYFDLHGTRLAPELVGRSFAVTDDGFLKKIRAAQFSNDMTRVVLDVSDVSEFSAFLLPNPYRLIIDIHGKGQPPLLKALSAGPGMDAGIAGTSVAPTVVPAPRTAATVKPTLSKPVPNTVATKSASTTSDVAEVSSQPGRVEATSVAGQSPGSRAQGSESASVGGAVVFGPAPGGKRTKRAKTLAEPGAPARAAVPTADGQTSLVRALGLKIGRIVIDAGHGGHDSGTIGVDGIEEKDVVLDVALRVGKLLHDRLGAEVVYTRSDDTFIPLETRTAIANRVQADLFLSIHANSSPDASARGVETYYLNFTSSPDALETAARENAVSDQSIHQLSELVKKITLKDKIAESREFASDVEASLYGGLQRGNVGLKDRGVKKAPFVVLIGANMPSILAEISFVTNARDATQLQQPEYRQRVAESLYKGVAKYEGGLSGSRVSTERAGVERVETK